MFRQLRARLAVYRIRRRQHWLELLWKQYQHLSVGMTILHKKRVRMRLKCVALPWPSTRCVTLWCARGRRSDTVD